MTVINLLKGEKHYKTFTFVSSLDTELQFVTCIWHTLNICKVKKIRACVILGEESVTYFSYRFKYVTDAVYVLQIQAQSILTLQKLEKVLKYLHIYFPAMKKKMQCQTFQRKPLAGEAAMEAEKVQMQYKPKPIYTVHRILFTQYYIFPFFLHLVASIFKSIISQLSCL